MLHPQMSGVYAPTKLFFIVLKKHARLHETIKGYLSLTFLQHEASRDRPVHLVLPAEEFDSWSSSSQTLLIVQRLCATEILFFEEDIAFANGLFKSL